MLIVDDVGSLVGVMDLSAGAGAPATPASSAQASVLRGFHRGRALELGRQTRATCWLAQEAEPPGGRHRNERR